MRRLLCGAALALLIPVSARAEDTPKAEVFGGYSYFRFSDPTGTSLLGTDVVRLNLNGWNASVAGNLNSWLGVVGDFSGHYGSPSVLGFGVPFVDVNQHSFLGGPRVSYRKDGRFTPFAHALFGVARAGAGTFGFGASENAFAMALGGGVDLRLTNSIAVRAVQADYVQTRFLDDRQNSARLSFGIVFRFGEK